MRHGKIHFRQDEYLLQDKFLAAICQWTKCHRSRLVLRFFSFPAIQSIVMAFPNRAVFPPLTRAHVYLVRTIGQNSVGIRRKWKNAMEVNHVMENNVMVNLYVRRNIRWAINPIPD